MKDLKKWNGFNFKIASYMAYFEDGGSSNDTINTFNGIYKLPNTKNKIVDSEKNLGVISIKDAFATSSNVAVARTILKNIIVPINLLIVFQILDCLTKQELI